MTWLRQVWKVSDGRCCEILLKCVRECWVHDGPPFGEALASKLDVIFNNMEWDDPNGNQRMTEARKAFADGYTGFAEELRKLDAPPIRKAG
jgi:hypothetical protein